MSVTNTNILSNYIHGSSPHGSGNPHSGTRQAGSGIWFDHVIAGTGGGCVVEGNLVEDCHQGGLENELGPDMIIRYNISRRNHGYHIFISTAQETEVYGNLVEPNNATTGARGIIIQQDDSRGATNRRTTTTSTTTRSTSAPRYPARS